MIKTADKISHVVVTKSDFPDRCEISVKAEDILPILERMGECEKEFPSEEDLCFMLMGQRRHYMIELLDGKGDILNRIDFVGGVIRDKSGDYCLKENGEIITFFRMLEHLLSCHQGRNNEELENSKFMLMAMKKGQTPVLFHHWSPDPTKNYGKVQRRILEEV